MSVRGEDAVLHLGRFSTGFCTVHGLCNHGTILYDHGVDSAAWPSNLFLFVSIARRNTGLPSEWEEDPLVTFTLV